MRKTIALSILIVAVVVAAIISVRVFSGEDNWICQNGQWVKHGNPSAAAPTSGCGMVQVQSEASSSDIVAFSPKIGETVKSPVTIEGQAKGTWFFEAVFPIKIVDENGKELATGHGTATSDWMTENFVPFTAEINFDPGTALKGNIVLQNDNPSGMPEKSKQIQIPVNFSPETTNIKVYFNNSKLDPEVSCNKVFAVEREIPKTTAVGQAALLELLKGPTDAEKADGYFTSINTGVKINKLTIGQGIAKADFDEQLDYQVGGSCRVSAIHAQITQTLEQFSSVKSVVISIDGRTEDILQP